MGETEGQPPARAKEALVGRRAERDIRQIYEWYEAIEPGLGDKFKAAIDASIAMVLANPKAFRVVYKNVRRTILRRFRYHVYYQAGPDLVKILRVIHASRSTRGNFG